MDPELERQTIKRGISELAKAVSEGHQCELISAIIEPLLEKKREPVEIAFPDVYIRLPANSIDAIDTAQRLLELYKNSSFKQQELK